MSSAIESTDLWSQVNQTQAQSRTRRKEANLAILKASRLPFIFRNANDVAQVRDERFPCVEYHLPTSKWKYHGRHILGDAQAFIDWMNRRRKA